MPTPLVEQPPPWPHALPSVRQFLLRPRALLVCLLLLNATFRPYAGIVHDARLYALQTVHRISPELHANDLYLKYGSQDSYSVFSLLAAPLVEKLGLPAAFYLLYLGGSALWLFAAERFVIALLGRKPAALAALVYLAVNSLPFGGHGTFAINENFLTPRLYGVALVMLGSERLLRGKPAASLGWIAGAMLVHPLMGFSGVCIGSLWLLLQSVAPRTFLVVALGGAAVFAGLLLCEPAATAVFGHMDEAWRADVRASNLYAVPTQWRLSDWLAIAVAFAIGAAGHACLRLPHRSKSLLTATMLIAAAGLATGLAAPFLPYKLLLQGQAYRALWPLQFIQIPILFGLIQHAWRGRVSHMGRQVSLAIVAGFAAVSLTGWQIVSAALILAAVYFWLKAQREMDLVLRSASRRRAAMALFAGLVPVAFAVADTFPDLLRLGLSRLAIVPEVIGPLCSWIAATGVVWVVVYRLPMRRRLLGGVLCGWIGIQTSFFLSGGDTLAEPFREGIAKDVVFVEGYLNQHRHRFTRTPSVYWPLGPLASIWLRLECDSYYSLPQTSGNMFNRGTAREGHRRAQLAGAFELHARREWLERSPELRREVCGIFGNQWKAEPTRDDLLRLCCETEIDLVVVPNHFEGWYAATNGRLFIYDARQIRQSLAAALPVGPNDITSESAGFAGSPAYLAR